MEYIYNVCLCLIPHYMTVRAVRLVLTPDASQVYWSAEVPVSNLARIAQIRLGRGCFCCYCRQNGDWRRGPGVLVSCAAWFC